MIHIFIKIIIRDHGQWDAACHQALQSEFNPWNPCDMTEGEYHLWLPWTSMSVHVHNIQLKEACNWSFSSRCTCPACPAWPAYCAPACPGLSCGPHYPHYAAEFLQRQQGTDMKPLSHPELGCRARVQTASFLPLLRVPACHTLVLRQAMQVIYRCACASAS